MRHYRSTEQTGTAAMESRATVSATLSSVIESDSATRLNPRLVVLAVVDDEFFLADREVPQISHESSTITPRPAV